MAKLKKLKHRAALVSDMTAIDVQACGGLAEAMLALFQAREDKDFYPKTAPSPPTMPPPLMAASDADADEWYAQEWKKIEEMYDALHDKYKQAVREWAVLVRARQGDANAASWIIRARADAGNAKDRYDLIKLCGPDGKPIPWEPEPETPAEEPEAPDIDLPDGVEPISAEV